MRWLRDKKGLSLVEMIVVVGLFGISMSVSMTILVNALQNQRSIRAEQKVISSARDALEVLAREIRLGYIDYDTHYTGGALNSVQDNLWVTTGSGNNYNFRITQEAGGDPITGQLVADDGMVASPLSSTDIRIDAIKFYVRPISDPYYIFSCTDNSQCDPNIIPVKAPGVCVNNICELEDQQPRVTIVLNASNRGQGFAKVELQTTVAVRTYKR